MLLLHKSVLHLARENSFFKAKVSNSAGVEPFSVKGATFFTMRIYVEKCRRL
jgi:hypothetical protein